MGLKGLVKNSLFSLCRHITMAEWQDLHPPSRLSSLPYPFHVTGDAWSSVCQFFLQALFSFPHCCDNGQGKGIMHEQNRTEEKVSRDQ